MENSTLRPALELKKIYDFCAYIPTYIRQIPMRRSPPVSPPPLWPYPEGKDGWGLKSAMAADGCGMGGRSWVIYPPNGLLT